MLLIDRDREFKLGFQVARVYSSFIRNQYILHKYIPHNVYTQLFDRV